uniref:Uncharacterized protein n=1 Tax=Arundo donax TaxID=35708 RepID=A0A0A9D882_ARUDO
MPIVFMTVHCCYYNINVHYPESVFANNDTLEYIHRLQGSWIVDDSTLHIQTHVRHQVLI